MVFYLKYRPQKIAELDISRVRERLYAILKNKDLPHAFLFTGSKGLGKTSTARILAKAINCEKVQELRVKSQESQGKDKIHNSGFIIQDSDIEPCNKCQPCLSITNGSSVDVLEIDAASNRGIDEIRSLRERVKYAPSQLSKKVYIIDEVHMLTTEAFNALLKTLEEPPPHVIFVLCTTEVWKVLPTIISRSFHISFEKPTKEELTRSLERVVAGEKLEVEKGVYEKLYDLSDGAFRDATKILEELAIAAGKSRKITDQLLESAYKMESIDTKVKELVKCLGAKDVKKALTVIEELSSEGVDFKIVNQKIVDKLRNELFAMLSVTSEKPSGSLSISEVKTLLDVFNESYKNIRFSVIPQLPLEIAIVTWCVQEGKGTVASKPVLEMTGKNLEAPLQPKEVVVEIKKNEISEGSDFFKELIDRVKQDNHTIAGILRGCTFVSIDDKELKIEAKYKFHGEKLSEEKARRIIEESATKLLSHDISLVVQTKQ